MTSAFLLIATLVMGTVLAYGLVAAPWWLQIATGVVIATLAIMCLLAYVSAPRRIHRGGEQ